METAGGDPVVALTDEKAMIENLRDAGCDEAMIDQFLQLGKAEKKQQQLRLLSRHKTALLDAVHENQKKIDCLDYLVYKMK